MKTEIRINGAIKMIVYPETNLEKDIFKEMFSSDVKVTPTLNSVGEIVIEKSTASRKLKSKKLYKMKKQWMTLTLPISSHVVKGFVYSKSQLSAKFQIWCRQFGITDLQSLALLVATTEEAAIYFNDLDEAKKRSSRSIG
jgi:hypothetical protein